MKLEIGSNENFEIRQEQYTAHITDSFTILYLSDLHFNRRSSGITAKMISRIGELDPTIILLGGDYVDNKKELVHLNKLLQSLSARKNVFAIAGNHDYAFDVGTIKSMVEANKVQWIEKKSVFTTIGSTMVQIDGTRPAPRKHAVDFSILCLHHPVDISRFKVQYNVAFAGHLHGGQLVLWQNDKGLYPGKIFFKWNLLKKEIDNCHFYISKGLGGRVPLRYNCAKEMLLINVTGTGKKLPG